MKNTDQGNADQPSSTVSCSVNSRQTDSGSKFRLPSSRYRIIFDAHKTYRGKTMVMWVRQGSGAGRKAGIVVSKRTFSLAVDRNRAKRLMREAFRLFRKELKPDVEVILVARSGIAKRKLTDVSRDLAFLSGKAGIVHVHDP
ncbi:MAG: ribonuclease P protein component [Kiritimatiellae bacterium]|nr:ribonuclease P protein component [Kiritimatiellia bacterium]